MKNITEIDKNFKTESLQKEDIRFYDIRQEPFCIYGVYKPEGSAGYIRMPEDVAKATNEGVERLNRHTSGGRIRFKTDSSYIALKCRIPQLYIMPHMPLSGNCGFDLYADGTFVKAFVPKLENSLLSGCEKGYEAIIELETSGVRETAGTMKDIVINFPLYSGVHDVQIGLQKNAQLLPGNEYTYQVPVVFYGSSITQGACASRPGNMYPSILSRRLDFDYINLGFSGSARGEQAIAEYIAKLPMSVFVYDYDHNAPTVDHLRKTHYRMYQTIRDSQPGLPIILASRPNFSAGKTETAERLKVIEDTYQAAKAQGDANIYFVSGQDMLNSHDPDMMNVDGCHPNDFGFFCMAEKLEEILKTILN